MQFMCRNFWLFNHIPSHTKEKRLMRVVQDSYLTIFHSYSLNKIIHIITNQHNDQSLSRVLSWSRSITRRRNNDKCFAPLSSAVKADVQVRRGKGRATGQCQMSWLHRFICSASRIVSTEVVYGGVPIFSACTKWLKECHIMRVPRYYDVKTKLWRLCFILRKATNECAALML